MPGGIQVVILLSPIWHGHHSVICIFAIHAVHMDLEICIVGSSTHSGDELPETIRNQ